MASRGSNEPAKVYPAASAGHQSASKIGNPKILLVDDDESVRVVLRQCLEHADFHVTEAKNGAEALALLGDDFDVLITDQQMPGMDGVELARQVWDRYPALAAILITGSPLNADTSAFSAVLRKPFHPFELVRSADQLARQGNRRRAIG